MSDNVRAQFLKRIGEADAVDVSDEVFEANKATEEDSENAEEVAAVAMAEVDSSNLFSEDDTRFADGLPEWSIEPPQVVVRRRSSL